MIYKGLNRIGMIGDIKTNGGGEIAEVYGGIGESNPIYYKQREMVGTSPMQFKVLGLPLTDYTILGNSYQDGTPSPDNPVEVVSVGEKTENLWDGQATIGSIKEDGTAYYHSNYFHTDFIACKENQSYVFYQNPDPNVRKAYLRGVFFYSNNNENSFQSYIGRTPSAQMLSFTTPENCTYLRVLMTDNSPSPYNSIVDATAYSKSIAVVEGETTPQYYVPYGYKIPITCGGVTQNIYLDEPLRKIGDYADEIDFKAGTVTRRIVKIDLTGGEVGYTYGGAFRIGIITGSISGIACLSNDYIGRVTTSANRLSQYDNSILCCSNTTGIFIVDKRFDTASSFKSYVSSKYQNGDPIEIYYVLATPTTESITLPQLPTLPGANTPTIGTTVQPSSVSITGHIKPTGYGNLTDVNGVYILDKDGVQIKVHGQ